MKNEKRSNENELEKDCFNVSCCPTESVVGKTSQCCESIGRDWDCRSKMAECMKKCRWFPLIPVVIGVLFMLLGVYLDVEVTRVLWMIFAGLITFMGILGLGMMRAMKKACSG